MIPVGFLVTSGGGPTGLTGAFGEHLLPVGGFPFTLRVVRTAGLETTLEIVAVFDCIC